MSERYRPKNGDRVRVVIEGEVGPRNEESGLTEFGVEQHSWFGSNVKSVEKLPDPEPVWRYGNVVKVEDYAPFMRASDRWVSCAGRGSWPDQETEIPALISAAWADGTLTVIAGSGG